MSKKKNKWEAKLMRARKWAFRELFDSEEEAARAYDKAVWRLRPEMALAYVNFPELAPSEAQRELAAKRKAGTTPSRYSSTQMPCMQMCWATAATCEAAKRSAAMHDAPRLASVLSPPVHARPGTTCQVLGSYACTRLLQHLGPQGLLHSQGPA